MNNKNITQHTKLNNEFYFDEFSCGQQILLVINLNANIGVFQPKIVVRLK